MVGDVVAKVIGMATLIFISRLMSVESFGTYSFAVAFGTSFTFFTDLGLDAATTRELTARDRSEEGRVLGSALLVKSILVLAMALISFVALFAFGPSLRLAAGVAAIAMLASIPGTPALLLNARVKVVAATIIQLAGAVAMLVGTLAVLAWRPSPTGLVAVASAVTILAGLALALVSRRVAANRLHLDAETVKFVCRAAVPIGVTLLGVIVYRRADQLLLGAFGKITDLGQYAAAVRLVDSLNIIPLGIATLALPVLTRAQSGPGNPDGRDLGMASTGYRLLAACILPLAALGTYEGGSIMQFVFGHPYRSAGASLAVLLWAHYFGFTGTLVNQVLIARRHSRYMATLTVIGGVVNLAANLWAIPAYGKIGAAYTSLIAYALPAVIGLFVPGVRDVFRACLRSSIRPAVAAAVLLFGLEVVGPAPKLGGFLFFVAVGPVLFVTGSVRVDEVRDIVSSVMRTPGGGGPPAMSK